MLFRSRGYSIAALLRRGGYRGDLRAIGEVLVDQLHMGLARSAEITGALQSAGLSATTAAAVIQSACTPQQKFHLTTLAALAADIERLGFAAPAILVVGDVVQLARTWNIEACLPADRVAAS